ncbi:hypothetical protein HY256_04830 [Candidatus Sumerlaeota bacterium]|nr:hypothetical protein [Candidatus Sumerlaeota bacterium]
MRAYPDQNRIHVTLKGPLNLGGVGAAMKGIVEHPDWNPGMDILLDLCGVEADFGDYMEIRSVIEVWRGDLKRLGPGRNAFFSDKAAHRDVARVVLIAGSVISKRQWRVFSNESEAGAWLDQEHKKSPQE